MPQLLWRLEDINKSIFLTFDDGPIPEITPWVLDQLDQYNARASFFCVGENVEKHPHIYKEIIHRSHCVGNHTFNHLSGWSTSHEEYLKNVDKASQVINSSLFRPPYGRLTPGKFKAIKENYQVVMWDVLSGDFDPFLQEELCLENVINNTQSGSIIVFHDSIKAWKNLEYTLPKVLHHFTSLGYSFESLEHVNVRKLNPNLMIEFVKDRICK